MTNKTVQELLQNLKQKGLSVPQIAELLDIDKRTIWRWLNGDVQPQNTERIDFSKLSNW
jgi:transcriptional regulator with XRE-family HTH domain